MPAATRGLHRAHARSPCGRTSTCQLPLHATTGSRGPVPRHWADHVDQGSPKQPAAGPVQAGRGAQGVLPLCPAKGAGGGGRSTSSNDARVRLLICNGAPPWHSLCAGHGRQEDRAAGPAAVWVQQYDCRPHQALAVAPNNRHRNGFTAALCLAFPGGRHGAPVRRRRSVPGRGDPRPDRPAGHQHDPLPGRPGQGRERQVRLYDTARAPQASELSPPAKRGARASRLSLH